GNENIFHIEQSLAFQTSACDCSCHTLLTAFGVREVDPLVSFEIRMERNIEQATMGGRHVLDFRKSGDGLVLELPVADNPQPTGPFGDQNVTAWKKDHAPRAVQALRDRDNANLLGVCLELQDLVHVLSGTSDRNKDECHDDEERINGSCDRQLHAQLGS